MASHGVGSALEGDGQPRGQQRSEPHEARYSSGASSGATPRLTRVLVLTYS